MQLRAITLLSQAITTTGAPGLCLAIGKGYVRLPESSGLRLEFWNAEAFKPRAQEDPEIPSMFQVACVSAYKCLQTTAAQVFWGSTYLCVYLSIYPSIYQYERTDHAQNSPIHGLQINFQVLGPPLARVKGPNGT